MSWGSRLGGAGNRGWGWGKGWALRAKLWAVAGALLLLAEAALAANALIYRGPGSCPEGCSEAAAAMAARAGLTPVYVSPDRVDWDAFGKAAVWIQPGGKSSAAAQAMPSGLKRVLREFIRVGGGYVGFCAGGFLATHQIGERDQPGLGILPGATALYRGAPDEAVILPIDWEGRARRIYWEGGPHFMIPEEAAGVEVTARYPDGTAASVRAPFGSGRVYVTGLHPEAPQDWRDYFGLRDDDGLDGDLAVEMIRWAAGTGDGR